MIVANSVPYNIHDKQAKAKIYTVHPGQLSLFLKKKLLLVGFEPTTLRSTTN